MHEALLPPARAPAPRPAERAPRPAGPGGVRPAARALLAAAAALAATAAAAQQPDPRLLRDVERRVTTLEGQMRAVQRRVFPAGDARFFPPEPEPAPAAPPPPPGPSPLAELAERVEALETQQRQLTGKIEELQFRLRQLETRLETVQGDLSFRLDALEGHRAPPGAGRPAADAGMAPPPTPRPDPTAPAAPARPAAADPEQQYQAAYRLYTAGDYPGAVAALEAFVKAHPQHPRASNAQFWAGRAYMAQQMHREAARAFLAGYQNWPRGERAHNSLLWLARALLAMNQRQPACQTLDQLRTAFPDRLTGSFAAEAASTRQQARCPA